VKISKRVTDMMDPTELQFARQLGATHIIGYMPDKGSAPYWEFLDLLRMRKHVESYGLELAALGSPPTAVMAEIVLAGPRRDEQIGNFCRCLNNMGRAGIPLLSYDFSITRTWGRWREGLSGGGRGDAGLMSFDEDLVRGAPPTAAGRVSAEEMWSRLAYFLERVVPVAEAAGVRLACHPDDPPVAELRGVARILSSVEGMKRLVDLVLSPANGLTFCLGTVAEMGADVIEAIRYFGRRKLIFIAHFRNIRRLPGDSLRFDEVFIDEGDVDMFRAMQTYLEVGYDGLLDADHAPVVAGDSQWGRHRGLAFSLGYITALKQVATRLAAGMS
jgi:mannonate dehydratase